MDWAKATERRDENHLSFVIWCNLYERFYGKFIANALEMCLSGMYLSLYIYGIVLWCFQGGVSKTLMNS